MPSSNRAQILNVSMYHNDISIKEFSFGEHAAVYKGEPDLKSILKAEVEAKATDWGLDARMLVTGKMPI